MTSASKFASAQLKICCRFICFLLVTTSFISSVQGSVFEDYYETQFQSGLAEATFFSFQYASFQDSCRNIRVSGNTLSARCRNERSSYISTSIQIRGITNVNGNLEYLRDGRGRSTYQDSCIDIGIDGANLNARCQREDGSYNYSTIFLRDIFNDNGRLSYSRGNGGGNPVDPTPPSNAANFQDSCRNIRVDVTTLYAQCRTENRRWRDSSIEIRGITNINGTLEYLRDGFGRSSYQDSCTNIRINGANLTARCQREDGSYNRTTIFLRNIVNDNGRLRNNIDR